MSEIPASIKITNRVSVRFSEKPRHAGWGVMIGTTERGRWAVATIAPVNGNPVYLVIALPDDEAAARKLANDEWTGMGL